MSFIDKLNAKFGNGSLQVNLIVEKQTYKRGEEVSGTIRLTGGKVGQKIIGIFIDLATEKKNVVKVYGDYKVHEGFTLEAKEEKEVPFTIILPEEGPFTKGDEMVQLITKVSIGFGMDPKDSDYIKVME